MFTCLYPDAAIPRVWTGIQRDPPAFRLPAQAKQAHFCCLVTSMNVSSLIWSVMCAPLDTVSTSCVVHFKLAHLISFIHGLTVCTWVLIDFVTFVPKLLRFEPQTFRLASKHCTTVLCLHDTLHYILKCWTFKPIISILHGQSIHWTPHHRPNVRGRNISGIVTPITTHLSR